ncbi:MAG: M1 family metallopeptidase [Myxococcota bacterium]
MHPAILCRDLLATAGLCVLVSGSLPGPTRAQDFSDHRYTLRAELDPEAHEVAGTAEIFWTNRSEVPVRELYFHLYLNAFESDRTVFMVEGGGEMRGVSSEGDGRIELESLSLAGRDVLQSADLELIPGDRTQLRVGLPSPLAPGEGILIKSEFRAYLPPVFARSGYAESFHMVAQWFPKPARVDPDGTWRSYPYHARGEFYSDFADYRLTVSTPTSFEVGASGKLVSERTDNGRVLRTFEANSVHDVAFAAYDRFLERAFEVPLPEREPVAVRILYPPGYMFDHHERATTEGLRRFSELLGVYPYPTLTVIVPPRGAEGAAGMEYPTLFLTAGGWWDVPGVHADGEDVTAHELGHQWCQGLLASDEVRFPMLDEGLTQWLTGEYLRHVHGRFGSATDAFGLRIDYFQAMRTAAVTRERHVLPPALPAHAYPSSDYGRSVYARTAVVLETVRRIWGPRRFEAALRGYADAQRFRHPVPADLYAAFDAEYWRGFSANVLRPALEDGVTGEVELRGLRTVRNGDPNARRPYITEVDARRVGTLPLPLIVELEDEDGARERIVWRGRELRLLHEHESRKKIVAATIDPDGHLLLDPNLRDNRRPRRKRTGPGPSMLTFVFQEIFGWLGP